VVVRVVILRLGPLKASLADHGAGAQAVAISPTGPSSTTPIWRSSRHFSWWRPFSLSAPDSGHDLVSTNGSTPESRAAAQRS